MPQRDSKFSEKLIDKFWKRFLFFFSAYIIGHAASGYSIFGFDFIYRFTTDPVWLKFNLSMLGIFTVFSAIFAWALPKEFKKI